MLKFFLLLGLPFSAILCSAQVAQKLKSILFMGVHPDDETAISEVLQKYAMLGSKVFGMIATDIKNDTRSTSIAVNDIAKIDVRIKTLNFDLEH